MGERLGYKAPSQIRELIKRNEKELQRYDTLSCRTTTPAGGGPATTEYWLKSCLIVMKSNTDAAADARQEIIEVYIAWRQGKVTTRRMPYASQIASADRKSRSGIDFLTETVAPDGCEAIVTNPPYRSGLDGRFAAKSLNLVPRVYMLCRLAFLESQRRSGVLDAGHLARVYPFISRLPVMHRDGWEGPKAQSAMAFAWFVWDRDHCGGAPKIERIGTKRCVVCDEQFIARDDALTRSNKCRQKAYRCGVTHKARKMA